MDLQSRTREVEPKRPVATATTSTGAPEPDDATFFGNTWRVLDEYLKATPKYLTRHHLDSFDAFLSEGIRNTIKSMNMVTIKRKNADNPKDIKIDVFVGGRDADRLYLDRPTIVDVGFKGEKDQGRPLLPNEARLRSLTYASNLYADVSIEYSAEGAALGTREFPRVKLGAIPIMLHSSACALRGLSDAALTEVGECPFDMGGYFVVQGREKVVVGQERPPTNRLFFRVLNDPKSKETKVLTKAYIRCVAPEGITFPKLFQFEVRTDGTVMCNVPYVGSYSKSKTSSSANVPLFVLFRALGVESDRDILEHIMLGEPSDAKIEAFLRPSILHAGRDGIYDQRAAVAALSEGTAFKSFENLQLLLRDDLFPNAGTDFPTKALMLGDLVRRLAKVSIGAMASPDRDHFSNRRFDVSGELFTSLFRDKYLLFRRNVMSLLDREWYYGPWKQQSNNVLTLVNETNVKRLFNSDVIEEGLISSLKGAWNVDAGADSGHETDNSIEGVAQDLNRVSYMAYVSHIRRLNHVVAGGEQAKQVEPHKLHPSQFGYVCPIDSPDGPRVGLQKHLSILTTVTLHEDIKPLEMHLLSTGLLLKIGSFRGRLEDLRGSSRVFANDLSLGVTFAPDRLTAYVRALRGANVRGVGLTTSVAWHRYDCEVRLLSDAGRCCRPLYVLREGVYDPTLRSEGHARTWARWTGPNDDKQAARPALHDLPWAEKDLAGSQTAPSPKDDGWAEAMSALTGGEEQCADIELLDIEECTNVVIAMSPDDARRRSSVRFTHCEVHPASMLSAVSASFPLLHHQNGAYTYLGIAQTKQAIGWYATSFASRMDTIAAVMHYPQVPMVTTGFANWLSDGRHAHGENLVMAVATYSGYNMDDGVLLNADAVARGMFHVTAYKTRQYQEEGSEEGEAGVVFANPLTLEANGIVVDSSNRFGKYDSIDKDGFPIPGRSLYENDMVMGKVSTTIERTVGYGGVDRVANNHVRREIRRDVSDPVARGEEGIVDHVFVTGEPGARHAKVSIRSSRVPELGDKVASRFAQKGVVGMMLPACDMPFCHVSGIIPDIVFNPNAFPKRMTVSHLLESLLAKTATMAGNRVRADTFEPSKIPEAAVLLERDYGMQRMGDEVVYNGRTGEQMDCNIFVGVNYVGRLKHLVVDKMNFRATGPVAALTHQATKGRKDKGGLRLGEMEQAAILAHGAASTLKESFMERADGATSGVVDSAALDVDVRNGKPCVIANNQAGVFRCVDHDSGHRATARVRVPYAAKLLIHELNALSIDVRIEPACMPIYDGDRVASGSEDWEGDDDCDDGYVGTYDKEGADLT